MNGFSDVNGGCATSIIINIIINIVKCPNDCNKHGKCEYKMNSYGLYEGKCKCNSLWEGNECDKSIYKFVFYIIIGKCPYGPDPASDYLKASSDANDGQSYTLVTISIKLNIKYRLVYRNRVASEVIFFGIDNTNVLSIFFYYLYYY